MSKKSKVKQKGNNKTNANGKKFRSVSTKVLGIVMIILMVSMSTLGYISYTVSRNISKESSLHELQEGVDKLGNNQLDQYINIYKNQLNIMAGVNSKFKRLEAVQEIYTGIVNMNQDVLDATISVNSGYSISGADGIVLANSQYDFRDQKWYKDAIATPNTTMVSDIYKSPETGKSIITIARGTGVVRDFDDERFNGYEGVTSIDLSLETLAESFNEYSSHDGVYLMLVNENNDITFHKDKSFIGQNMSQTPAYVDVLSQIEDGEEFPNTIDYDGIDSYFVKTDIESSGWVLYGVMPSTLVFQGLFLQNLPIIIAALICLIVASILMTIALAKIIIKPIDELTKGGMELAKGNLSESFSSNSNDEIGILFGVFSKVADTINNIVLNIDELAIVHKEGDFEARLNVDEYEGDYIKVPEGINLMASNYVDALLDITSVIGEISNGNFETTIKNYPGKQHMLTVSLEELVSNLGSVNHEINGIVNYVSEGSLDKRVDLNNFEGDWKQILFGLNGVMDAISTPLDEISNVLYEMEQGNLSSRINGEYKGEFLKVKNIVNNSMTSTSDYINEISLTLGKISNNNLDVEILSDYAGDFNSIKVAINSISNRLNDVFADFYAAAQEVSAGANQVAESSISLAEGATVQVSSLEELNATVEIINEKTKLNAKSAQEANDISKASKENAVAGDEHMKLMLKSMEDINNSSNKISNIIKVIEDIAFQTNLLALNAAVEAARAGVHGKGFAVVAEEVRNLASRSQTAAKDTSELIKSSILNVEAGSGYATQTAKALDKIVLNVSEVSDIIENITVASLEQETSINEVSMGLNSIEAVVQNTSATSEEGVSTSEELSSQSEMLKNLIAQFNLKK